MSGIRGRTFEQWVFRRKINLVEWLENHQIRTIDELNDWCKNNELLPPTSKAVIHHFQKPVSEPVLQSTVKIKPAQSSKKNKRSKHNSKLAEQAHDEVWHVPAAERPRRKKK